jgi:hypothetical protein
MIHDGDVGMQGDGNFGMHGDLTQRLVMHQLDNLYETYTKPDTSIRDRSTAALYSSLLCLFSAWNEVSRTYRRYPAGLARLRPGQPFQFEGLDSCLVDNAVRLAKFNLDCSPARGCLVV